MTDKEKLDIAIEALKHIAGINDQPNTVQLKLSEKGMISVAREALAQVGNLMLLKDAVCRRLSFNYKGDRFYFYDNTFYRNGKVQMGMICPDFEWVLKHQDELVEVEDE